jgi:hypothetical protein
LAPMKLLSLRCDGLTEKYLAKGVSEGPTNETTYPMKATMTALVLTLLTGWVIGANAA